MATRDGFENGAPAWVDLATSDTDRARDFYTGVFGWDWSPEDLDGAGTYWTAILKGRRVAGLSAQQPAAAGTPSAWNTHINVASADETAALATTAGAEVLVPPMDIAGSGRFAMLRDPAGAAVGLWQPGEHKGAEVTGEPGAMVWNEVLAADTAAEVDFYRTVFGWEPKALASDQGMAYTTFMLGNDRVAGTYPPPPELKSPRWQVWFGTSDTDATIARVRELGGDVVMGPTETNIGKLAFLKDPTGAEFSVHPADEEG